MGVTFTDIWHHTIMLGAELPEQADKGQCSQDVSLSDVECRKVGLFVFDAFDSSSLRCSCLELLAISSRTRTHCDL